MESGSVWKSLFRGCWHRSTLASIRHIFLLNNVHRFGVKWLLKHFGESFNFCEKKNVYFLLPHSIYHVTTAASQFNITLFALEVRVKSLVQLQLPSHSDKEPLVPNSFLFHIRITQSN
jgi:hypothetical protein